MVNSNRTKQPSYGFGDVFLDGENFRVHKAGQLRTLTPRAFDVLRLLIEHRGRVVEKQELFDQIWQGTFVTDNALTRVVKEIRQAIGDDANTPRYIETIPKRGYRFIAEINRRCDNRSAPRFTAPSAGYKQTAIPTLAVLPFKLFSPFTDDEYLGLGLADALITRLSNVRQIVVRPTSAVLQYAQVKQNPIEIGQELRVESVLEGSLRKLGERVRATVQLVSVASGNALWADKFDERFTDIFTVEDAIAERVAEALALKLSLEEKHLLAKHYTEDVEAYQVYLRGRYYANKFTLEDFHKAIESFNRALDLDPDYALAYAGIAEAYWIAADLYLNPKEAVKKAQEAAIKAVEADDSLAAAHAFVAATKMSYDWNWVEAENAFKRAIELNPGFAPAHHWYGWYQIVMGRHDDSIASMERAKQLDPFSLGINWFLGTAYGLAGRYDEALEKALDLIDLAPNFWGGHWMAGYCYTGKGEYPKAIVAYQKAGVLDASPMIKGAMAHCYALWEKTDEARAVLNELKELEKQSYVPPFYIALIYSALGENDEAFAYLEKAYDLHDSSLPLIKVDERLGRLRSDPRLKDLIVRIGLTP